MKNGKYFDVQENENYELMPDYDFYEAQKAFPTDSILNPGNMNYRGGDTVITKNTRRRVSKAIVVISSML